jgi:hypothetical protein
MVKACACHLDDLPEASRSAPVHEDDVAGRELRSVLQVEAAVVGGTLPQHDRLVPAPRRPPARCRCSCRTAGTEQRGSHAEPCLWSSKRPQISDCIWPWDTLVRSGWDTVCDWTVRQAVGPASVLLAALASPRTGS